MEVFEAVRAGDNARLRQALRLGVDLATTHDYRLPIEIAASSSNLEAVQLLLAHGSPLTLITLLGAWVLPNVPLWEFLFRMVWNDPMRGRVSSSIRAQPVLEVAFAMGFLRPSDDVHHSVRPLFQRLLERIPRCRAAAVCFFRLPVCRDVQGLLARAF
jgi:hypothetical protein